MSGGPAPFFLLEIGCEELPDRMIVPALEHLGSELTALAQKERIGSPVLEPPLLGTPRRLAIRARGLLARQEDREVEVAGPRVEAAHDSGGKPTRALEGFARAQGVPVAELVRIPSPRGDYLAARKRVPGKAARDLFAAALPSIIAGIPFGKTMRWGDGAFRFARPVHWIVCLYGSEVVPFEAFGVASGRISLGARFLGSPPLEIPDARDYLDALGKISVVPDIGARRERIRTALDREAGRLGRGCRIEEPPGLIETVNGMVECPVAAAGDFDPAFLRLPAPVLSTAMIHHQRFFPVRAPDGSLGPHYVAVLNCRPDPATVDGIRRGNERVLRARLRDADFFWREDLKRSMEERIPDLEKILFETTLGSYRQKAARIERLTRDMCRSLSERGQEVDAEAAAEAARLAKSDLTTLMVKEFPELQGIVGALYARQEGRRETVCRALEQQYLAGGDAATRGRFTTREGAVLAVADRLDTLAGFFLLGKVPTGSRDPYGLRRAAAALVQATLDQDLGYPLDALIHHAADLHRIPGTGDSQARARLGAFIEERLRHLCQEIHGFRYDAVNAALAIGGKDLCDAFHRAEALNGIKGHPDFEALSLSYRRLKNILAGQERGPLRESALLLEEEKALLRALEDVERKSAPQLASGDYTSALRTMATLRVPLDRFFEKVLVMDPDTRTRVNRLALLARISDLFLKVGDFAEMVLEGETTAEPSKRSRRG